MTDLIHHDVEQNTDEWMGLRAGKITSSAVSDLMANSHKPFGEPAKKYASKLAIERITGKPCQSGYSNAHMQRGHEQEPIAIAKYEEITLSPVSRGGFYERGDIGDSPDGIVEDGLVEVKSVIATSHYKTIKRQSFDPAYKWQLAFKLYVTQKPWVDFVSYCQDYPDDKQIFIYRCKKEDFECLFSTMQMRVDQFSAEIDICSKIINESSYINQ